ncbi:hypothetical protein CIK05_09565 [Bdellovibrio sp. qaytius]|nr:hypothetical protein CIK05_09565 [Bdellovibrio sp. qaytius]
MKNHFLLLFVCFSFFNCTKSNSPTTETSSVNSPSSIPTTEDPPVQNTPTPQPEPQPTVNGMEAVALLKGSVQLIVTPNPNGHTEFLRSINKTMSGDIIRMEMFHLTDTDIINALVSAQNRGVTVKVILDGISLNLPTFDYAFEKLKAAGVDVRASTSAFTITHSKAMVINTSEAFITAINLTKLTEITRDFGLIVHDTAVIGEVINVFEQDWQNASSQQGITPQVSELHLVLSPVNSLAKLVNLISSAKKSLSVQVENLGHAQIQSAFIAAAKKGIIVRVLVPMCSKGGSAKLNFPYLKELAAGGVQTKVMPTPESIEHPYMHSKMVIADGVVSYIGSVNFSKNSTTYARELGILFSEIEPIKTMSGIFEKDWASAIAVPAEETVNCSGF